MRDFCDELAIRQQLERGVRIRKGKVVKMELIRKGCNREAEALELQDGDRGIKVGRESIHSDEDDWVESKTSPLSIAC